MMMRTLAYHFRKVVCHWHWIHKDQALSTEFHTVEVLIGRRNLSALRNRQAFGVMCVHPDNCEVCNLESLD